MSKILTIKTEIKDKIVLIDTLKELGYNILEKDNSISAFSKAKKLIFSETSEGTYSLSYDMDNSKEVIDRIKQRYAYNKIIKDAKKAGFNIVKAETLENNSLKVILRKWQGM